MTAPGNGTLVDFGSMQRMSAAFAEQADQMTRQNQEVEAMDQSVRAAYTSQAQVIFSQAVDAWQQNFTTITNSCVRMSENLSQAGTQYTAADDDAQAGATTLAGQQSPVQAVLG